MKFIYHEIELTRRCNGKCQHCMRGDAQAIDISREHLDIFFSKTEHINCLTLTGGEVSLVPKKIHEMLDLAKAHHTPIDVCGIISNGLHVSDAFIEACLKLKNYVTRLNLTLSMDQYHKPIPPENISKLAEHFELSPRQNMYIQPSGRALNIPWRNQIKGVFTPLCIFKPYWVINGWVMQPTYLNALGEFVVIDGSYEEQPRYKIGDVSNLSYEMFEPIHPQALMAWHTHNPFGVSPQSWPEEQIARIARQGTRGPDILQYVPYREEFITELIHSFDKPETAVTFNMVLQ